MRLTIEVLKMSRFSWFAVLLGVLLLAGCKTAEECEKDGAVFPEPTVWWEV